MQRHSRFLTAGAVALAAILFSGLIAFANVPLVQVTPTLTRHGLFARNGNGAGYLLLGNTIVSAFQVGGPPRPTAAVAPISAGPPRPMPAPPGRTASCPHHHLRHPARPLGPRQRSLGCL